VTDIKDDFKKFNGSFLEIESAFIQSIELLCKRKNKIISELLKPLTIKLSVDGTVLGCRKSFVVYTLCAFEENDTEFPTSTFHVVLGLLSGEENYEIISHYFKKLHERIQFAIQKNFVEIEKNIIPFKFIICSDMK
jgi:hypothetical protein